MSQLLERITSEPGKCGGRPCIRGLRVRVIDVLELLAAGLSHAQIVEELPTSNWTTSRRRSPSPQSVSTIHLLLPSNHLA